MSPNGPAISDVRDSNEELIDISAYLKIIKKYQLRIFSISFVLTVLSVLIVLSMTPSYVATTSLLIESEEAKVVSIEQIYGLDPSNQEYFQTQYEILKSRYIAEKVVDRLELVNNPLFQPDEDALGNQVKEFVASIGDYLPFLPSKRVDDLSQEQIDYIAKQAVIDLFIESLSISPVKNTQVVKITFESEQPEFAALAANSIAEAYIDHYLEAKFEMTSKATTWLNESLSGLQEKLEGSERKLADFYEQEQLVDVDGVVGLASSELQALTNQLLEAQNRLKNTQFIFDQVSIHGGNISELARLPEVVNHPSIQTVKESELDAESRISELSKVYGPKHQKMISAVAELKSIQDSLNKQISALVSGITQEYRQTEAQVANLRTAVEQAKVEYRKLSSLEATKRQLVREVEINQQLYDSFFTRLKETSEIGGFESSNARILDEASIPTIPSKPKKALIVIGTFILSLGFGAALAIVLEVLNSVIRSVDDVERGLGQRMLGLIPWQQHKKNQNMPLRHYFDPEHHTFSEAIRTLRTSIQLLSLEQDNKVTLVTSSVPREGKTTVSINLAFTLGQLGKTILIDSDLRRPTVGSQFGLPGFQPGLSNIIAGSHAFEDCVAHDVKSNIDILCAGTIPPNPLELISSEKFSQLIDKLKQTYDHIVIDSAPTQAVSDAMVTSKLSDTVLYVVRSDSTSTKLVQAGISRFMQIGRRVDGVILNQVRIKKKTDGYNYGGYYDNYGYTANVQSGHSQSKSD